MVVALAFGEEKFMIKKIGEREKSRERMLNKRERTKEEGEK